MNTIIFAAAMVTIIGIICAVVLSAASKIMHVKVDERITLLTDCMPGANCGACGYPGCSAYANALISGNVKTNLCTPGGEAVLLKISSILGVEGESIEKKIAVVNCYCNIGRQQKKMDYKGVYSCEAARALYGGENACAFGCLGYGDCKTVCPSGAICMEEGIARIVPNLCSGCGVCVKTCPNNLISIEKASSRVFVLCKNIEKGAVTRKKCVSGCIACTKCVKECPENAITITENLAQIDREKCSNCGKCIEVCVTKCIKLNYFPAVS